MHTSAGGHWPHLSPTWVYVTPGGGAAVAAPVVLPVAIALVRVGLLLSGIVNGSVLEAGTRFPPTIASADTM